MEQPIPKKSKTAKQEIPRIMKGKWCDYCERDLHNTRDCFKLKALKQKKNDTPQHSGLGSGKRHGNLSWKKPIAKEHENAYLNKEQATALMEQVVKKHSIKKESRKRQVEDLGAVEEDNQADAFASLSLSSDDEESSAD